jgi:membrane protein
MDVKKTLNDSWTILKCTFQGFSDNKVTKLGGSLAYSAVFSMGPMLIVVISLCGLFLGKDAVEGRVYGTLAGFLGQESAASIQAIIKQAAISGHSVLAVVVGAVVLLVGATSVFSEIQDSINDIWGVKPKPKRGWLKMLQNRFLSFSVIVGLGFLLLVSMFFTTVLDAFSDQLHSQFPGIAIVVIYIINQALTLVVTTVIFAVIFRVLPDADIQWRDVIAGAIVTALLFMLGKFAISIYISKTMVATSYGVAGSLIVVLLWIYYSSLILYLGAEFTKAYAIQYGSEIHPNEYAVTTRQVEVETGNKSIQENAAADVPGDKK